MAIPDKANSITKDKFIESHAFAAKPIATGARVVILRNDLEHQADFVRKICARIDGNYEVSAFGKESEPTSGSGIVYEDLGVAVIDHEETGMAYNLSIALNDQEEVLDHLPEFYAFAIQTPRFINTQTETWGLQAIGAHNSNYSGKNVKVAVLDTGIDINHPNFAIASTNTRSFVQGQSVDDLNGHGTHCAGTIAGNVGLAGYPRYGVAPNAELLVGKVLSNSGTGRQQDILAGMVWAVKQGARVISMSLGSPTSLGSSHNPAYERAAQYALNSGSLVIAAAGNDSDRRFGYVAPVSAPADSPSAVAVAAVDQALGVANFSNGGINGGGGTISLAAPGVNVFSSCPLPRRYRSISGTSMACPHVAGVAVLEIEANQIFDAALRTNLESKATNIGGTNQDVGHGFVTAP